MESESCSLDKHLNVLAIWETKLDMPNNPLFFLWTRSLTELRRIKRKAFSELHIRNKKSHSSSENHVVDSPPAFRVRTSDESHELCWGHISLQTDPILDGHEMLVWLTEQGTKTCKGEENGHRHRFSPKAFAKNTGVLSIYTSCSKAIDLKK